MPHEPALQFRAATMDDVALVRDIVRAAYSKWIPVIGREPSPICLLYTSDAADE